MLRRLTNMEPAMLLVGVLNHVLLEKALKLNRRDIFLSVLFNSTS